MNRSKVQILMQLEEQAAFVVDNLSLLVYLKKLVVIAQEGGANTIADLIRLQSPSLFHSLRP